MASCAGSDHLTHKDATPPGQDADQTPACSDGLDNDGDGKTDYPYDPGCDDASDTDEADSASKPECSDGLDNDGDGKTDFPGDPGCTSASGSDESRDPIKDACGMGVDAVDITRSGTAAGDVKMSDPAGTMAGSCGGTGAPEKVFLYRIDKGKHDLVLSTVEGTFTSPADTVVYMRSTCTDTATELGCNDDVTMTNKQSQLTVSNLGPGRYWIFVDPKLPADVGSFNWKLTVASYLSRGEPCDSGDGGSGEVCLTGTSCKAPAGGGPAVCTPPGCNDGMDNDGDGKTDYPNDPGCSSASDETETDPATLPQCSDKSDNDGDGMTDYPADPGCASAADNDERDECVAGVPINGLDFFGATDTASGSSKLEGTCTPATKGPEKVYLFIPKGDYSSVIFSTDNSVTATTDTVLYVRAPGCDKMTDEKACNNDLSGSNKHSTVSVLAPKKGDPLFVVVDTTSTLGGKFKLTVRATVAKDAACDPAATDVTCEDGFFCKSSGGMGTCQVPKCNDGMDNDSDGKTDFPNDPGCDANSDDDEADGCPGPTCPQCANGMDDDGDGATDYPFDSGCTSASDNLELDQCTTGVDVNALPDTGATDTLGATFTGKYKGSCDTSGTPLYPEKVYGYSLSRTLKSLTFSTDNADAVAYTLVYVRKGACNDAAAEVGCAGGSKTGLGPKGATLTLSDPTSGSYFVFVDNAVSVGGAFRLTVAGVIPGGQVCDLAKPNFTCEAGYACRSPGSGMPTKCLPAACNDGMDNDSDGKTDYPADPGCSAPSDDDETNPATAPLCADGKDNDLDGLTDYPADPGCSAASDGDETDECKPGVPYQYLPWGGDIGTFTYPYRPSQFTASCNAFSASLPEAVYYLRLDRKFKRVTFTTSWAETNYDTVLYVKYAECDKDSSIVACNDNTSATNTRSTVTLTDPKLGAYYLFVDGGTSPSFGTTLAYKLTGSGIIAQGEACDSGTPELECEPGTLCKGAAGAETCQRAACANGTDDDSDGKTDYPSDPGCGTPEDDDETNPGTTPACADGMDNDGNGKTDYPADPGCLSAADTLENSTCFAGLKVKGVLPLGTTTASVSGTSSVTAASCAAEPTKLSAEDVYLYRVDRLYQSLTFATTTPTAFDSVIYVRSPLCSTITDELVCNDDTGLGALSQVTVAAPTFGAGLYVFVDGKSGGTLGSYTLTASAVVGAGERCTPGGVGESCELGTTCKGTAGMERCNP